MSPKPTTIFHFLSIVISSGALGLSAVNFGVLCIWINSTTSFLTLAYHAIILFLGWRRNPRVIIVPLSTTPKIRYGAADPKLPTYPSPAYSPPPPYEKTKLVPNRAAVPQFRILNTATSMGNDNEGGPLPSGPFYSLPSLLSIAILTILSIVGFSMTVELSIRGAKSLLPAEHAKGMTFPWNMKVQKAQCIFLGVQILLSLIMLVLCAHGRSKISKVDHNRREEIEYGLASPQEPHISIQWDKEGV